MTSFFARLTGALVLCGAASVGAATLAPRFDPVCNCYRDVPYGSATWVEPTCEAALGCDNPNFRQVMDIFLPTTPATGPRPVVFWGHSNGYNHRIAYSKRRGSEYMTLVKPVIDAGYIFVSYEFRHPVINQDEPGAPIKTDIRDAINRFSSGYARRLSADMGNTFISGRSRGAGLGLLTALTNDFAPGITVRAVWGAQAQSTFDCQQMSDLFITDTTAPLFALLCAVTLPRGAGSSLDEVRVDSPPVFTVFDEGFFRRKVPVTEFGEHHPDFGLALCRAYTAVGNTACGAVDQVAPESFYRGMVQFFNGYRR